MSEKTLKVDDVEVNKKEFHAFEQPSTSNLLVKNLSDNDFKYLSQEFTGQYLKLVKQNGVYPYEYMDNFKKYSDKNCLIDLTFLVL